MPIRTLKIVNGPNFRGFALSNGIISESQWDQVFTMDQEIPDEFTIHKDKKKFQMRLKMFGRAPGEDADHFVFIGYMTSYSAHFYIGNYNVRTRDGWCDEIAPKEFFESVLMRQLFPNLV